MPINQNYKTISKVVTESGDRIEIRTIPLPLEKYAAWMHSMRLIAQMLIEIVKEEHPPVSELINAECLSLAEVNDEKILL